MKRATTAALCLVLVTACGGSNEIEVDAPVADAAVDAIIDAPPDAPGFYRSIPTTLNRNVDILFVVDNSDSMLAEQQQLTANFPAFVNVLEQVTGGFPDVHLGILSSDVGAASTTTVPGCTGAGDNGDLVTGPPGNTCAAQFGLQGAFISDIAQPNGTRLRNYSGDLEQLFTCMASLGTAGCGYEMHLESMYRALQPGKNPGFYRGDAHLAVIFLADEDDCSTELGTMFGDPNAGIASQLGPRTSFRCHEFGVRCPNDPNPRVIGPKMGCTPDTGSFYMFEVQRYIDFLRTLKDPSGDGTVTVAGIVGTFDPSSGSLAVGADRRTNDPDLPEVMRSCVTRDPADPDDGAMPPVRLQRFLSAFPEHNAMVSICGTDLSDALVEIAREVKTAIGNACIDAQLADQDSSLPGLQPSCTVHENATALPVCETMIQSGASCVAGNVATPCWCFLSDAVACPATVQNPSSLALAIARGGAQPPADSVVSLYCRTPQ